MSEGTPSRVAIKFGAPSSNGTKKATRPPPPTTLGKRQRNRFDADSDSEAEDNHVDKHESITHFGANGAEFDAEEHTQRRKDHTSDRQARRPEKGSQQKEARHQKNGQDDSREAEPIDEEQPIKWGLTVRKKSSTDAAESTATQEAKPSHDIKAEDKTPRTADEEAMDALLGKSSDDTERRRLLLQRTEDDAYRDATEGAPDVDKLDVYNDFPVEGFGASLLRGQGWDGQMRGPKVKEVQRRPNQMGLGAKKLKGEEDLGAWDQKTGSSRRPRLDEYKRDREKERSRRNDRYRDSYKSERDRDRDRGGGHRHRDRDYR